MVTPRTAPHIRATPGIGAMRGGFNDALDRLLGRPFYLSPDYPYVHKEFGQKLWTDDKIFLRANFGNWILSLFGGVAEESNASIMTYWNVGDLDLAFNPVQVTDVMYVQGTGALFGKEQVVYGAFLARMSFGNYANEKATNATPSVLGTDAPTVHGPPGQQNQAAAKLNGTNQWLSHADDDGLDLDTGDFSIEVTVNPRREAAVILAKQQDVSNFYTLQIDSSWELAFQANVGASPKILVNTLASSRLRENRDYHIVVVVDRDSAAATKIYIDGVDVTDGTPTVSTDTIVTTGEFLIGQRSAAIFWDGRIRHVRLYKGTALTSTEVANLHNGGNGSFKYGSIQTNGTVTDPTQAWDLDADVNADKGGLNLTNNGSVTWGGGNATDTPAAGDTTLDVDDPYLWIPQDYFDVDLPRWVQIEGFDELMQVSQAGVKSAGTITLTGNPSDGETITIGDKTYTFESGTIDTEGEIAIGSDFVVTARNIVNAIMKGPQGGVAYQAASAHPLVSAEFDRVGTAKIIAHTPGTLGDNVVFSEAASNLTMDGAGNLGGTTAGSDALSITVPHARDQLEFNGIPAADGTVTIDGIVYTWKASPSAAYEVDLGADAAGCRDNLRKAINASGTAGTDYGTGTEKHPTCWAWDGIDNGPERNLIVEAREAGSDGDAIAVSDASTNVNWADTAADQTLHKLLIWPGTASANCEVIDYVFKSFGFGNAADPNCAVVQIRDGRFELLSRSQGRETRRILDPTDGKYLTEALDPHKTRTFVILWTSEFVAAYATGSVDASDPDLLEITDINMPYWPLETDIISYWGGNSDIIVPWVEFYSVYKDIADVGELLRRHDGAISGATDTSMYTVPAQRALFVTKFRSLLVAGTAELNDYDGQLDTALDKVGVESEVSYPKKLLIKQNHQLRITTDAAGTHAVSFEGVLV